MTVQMTSMLIACSAVIAAFLAYDSQRPDVLLVGDITVDVMSDGSRPAGGSVSYAAAAMHAFGLRACIVTAAGGDADLSVFEGHELHVIPAHATLTFEHTHTDLGLERQLRVTASPGVSLSLAHVPPHCRRARLVLLGPLIVDDIDCASFMSFDGLWDWFARAGQQVGLMGQGLQRVLNADGWVHSLQMPSRELLASLGPRVSLFLSEVETVGFSAAALTSITAACALLVVTEGKAGHRECRSDGSIVHFDAHPVDNDIVVDTNGAGDVFATTFMLVSSGLLQPAFTPLRTPSTKPVPVTAQAHDHLGHTSDRPVIDDSPHRGSDVDSTLHSAEQQQGSTLSGGDSASVSNTRGTCSGCSDVQACPNHDTSAWQHLREPGHFATWAASRAIMQPQSCKPRCAAAGLWNTLTPGTSPLSQGGEGASSSDAAQQKGLKAPESLPMRMQHPVELAVAAADSSSRRSRQRATAVAHPIHSVVAVVARAVLRTEAADVFRSMQRSLRLSSTALRHVLADAAALFASGGAAGFAAGGPAVGNNNGKGA